jgi:hypothetical protein
VFIALLSAASKRAFASFSPYFSSFGAVMNSTSSFKEKQDLADDHARAIGRIVVAWNEYQELLGQMFAKLFGRAQWSLALSAWHALDNDRAQRAMLVAAAHAKFKPTDRALKEIIWLVEKTNQMISDQRNTGIHTPLMNYTDQAGVFQILPLAMFGNKRAVKLIGHNLLREFGHYEQQIRKIYTFANAISFAITPKNRRRGRVTWPDRPQLLHRAPQVNSKP